MAGHLVDCVSTTPSAITDSQQRSCAQGNVMRNRDDEFHLLYQLSAIVITVVLPYLLFYIEEIREVNAGSCLVRRNYTQGSI